MRQLGGPQVGRSRAVAIIARSRSKWVVRVAQAAATACALMFGAGSSCYRPSFSDCSVRCNASTSCPPGTECQAGYCVDPARTSSCGLPDDGSSPDSRPSDGPTCDGATSTSDGTTTPIDAIRADAPLASPPDAVPPAPDSAPVPYCNDGTCNNGEDCVSCPDDCGPDGHMGTGDTNDPCSEAPETWRCAYTPRFNHYTSQVCRGGVWLVYNTNPPDCAACCYDYNASTCGSL